MTTRAGKAAKAAPTATAAENVKTAPAAKTAKRSGTAKASGGLKTRQNEGSVLAFLAGVSDEARRADCQRLVALMSRVTGESPKMWGTSIVGFGTFHYVYASGREGDWPPIAFSPRKKDLTIYASPGLDHYKKELSRLGTFTRGVSCLYVKRLDDVDLPTLEVILADSYRKLMARDA